MRELEDSLIFFFVRFDHVRAERDHPATRDSMKSGPHSVIVQLHFPPRVNCVDVLFI